MNEPVTLRSRKGVLRFYREDCVEGMKRRVEPCSVDVVVLVVKRVVVPRKLKSVMWNCSFLW